MIISNILSGIIVLLFLLPYVLYRFTFTYLGYLLIQNSQSKVAVSKWSPGFMWSKTNLHDVNYLIKGYSKSDLINKYLMAVWK